MSKSSRYVTAQPAILTAEDLHECFEGGVQFAQEVLSGLPFMGGCELLTQTKADIRRVALETGLGAGWADAMAEKFSEVAANEWRRIEAASGNARMGHA